MSGVLTAAEVFECLAAMADDERRERMQATYRGGDGDAYLGVRMGDAFALAKRAIELPVTELDVLLDSDVHEVRVTALSAMAKRAARRRTTSGQRAELYELYLRRHDRINAWGLVDLAAHHVVGRHLADRPRDPLYELAHSKDVWRRRTAIYATLHFVRAGDVDDALAIAATMLGERHDLQQQITGGVLRDAGKHAPERLEQFLDEHAAKMPRAMLRAATELLTPADRERHRMRPTSGSET